jgi:hypothetical protein
MSIMPDNGEVVFRSTLDAVAAAQPADLTPTYLGALLALAAALLTQVLVIPWVQARSRRRERWQSAVSEMSAILEEDLDRAITRYHFVASRLLTHPEYTAAARGDKDALKLVSCARDSLKI